MKNIILFLAFALAFTDVFGQKEVELLKDGIIFPRMTVGQRNALSPTEGQVIYNTSANRLDVYDGSNWATPANGIWNTNGSKIYYNAGFVGIGTTNPVSSLHLSSNGNLGDIRIDDAFPFVNLNTNTGIGNAGLKFEDQGDYTGWIYHNSANDAIYISGENTSIAQPNLVIDNTGFVGVGTANPAYPLHVIGVLSLGNLQIENLGSSNLGLDGDVVPFGGSGLGFDLGNNVSTEYWDDVVAIDFITFSDFTTKDDIVDLQSGLKEILALRPVEYRYKSNITPDNRLRFGLIAQEAESILPSIVIEEDIDVNSETNELIIRKSDLKAINYMDVIPVLIRAIQEQNEHIIQLEERLSVLEKK